MVMTDSFSIYFTKSGHTGTCKSTGQIHVNVVDFEREKTAVMKHRAKQSKELYPNSGEKNRSTHTHTQMHACNPITHIMQS